MPFIPVPPSGTFAEKVDDMVTAMLADPLFSVQPGYDLIVITALQTWVGDVYSETDLAFVVTWSEATSYRFTLELALG